MTIVGGLFLPQVNAIIRKRIYSMNKEFITYSQSMLQMKHVFKNIFNVSFFRAIAPVFITYLHPFSSKIFKIEILFEVRSFQFFKIYFEIFI